MPTWPWRTRHRRRRACRRSRSWTRGTRACGSTSRRCWVPSLPPWVRLGAARQPWAPRHPGTPAPFHPGRGLQPQRVQGAQASPAPVGHPQQGGSGPAGIARGCCLCPPPARRPWHPPADMVTATQGPRLPWLRDHRRSFHRNGYRGREIHWDDRAERAAWRQGGTAVGDPMVPPSCSPWHPQQPPQPGAARGAGVPMGLAPRCAG